jgi:hypothetical protein
MKVVIDIEEDHFLACKHWLNEGVANFAETIIANGKPLPKGHGRLIDADDAERERQNVLDCEIEHPMYPCTIRDVLEGAPTIIEADKAESEE